MNHLQILCAVVALSPCLCHGQQSAIWIGSDRTGNVPFDIDWTSEDNWSGWNPAVNNGIPYPKNWSANLARYAVNVTFPKSGDFAIIPLGHDIPVMNLDMAKESSLGIYGWLTVHGGNAIRPVGRTATIYGGFVIHGEFKSFLQPGKLRLGSGPEGWSIGLDYRDVDRIEIGADGGLSLNNSGSGITNWDNFLSLSPTTYPADLTERIVRNSGGRFLVEDREWMPAANVDASQDIVNPMLINYGWILLEATRFNAQLGGKRPIDEIFRPIDNHGTVHVKAKLGLTAVAHLRDINPINSEEAIFLDGAGASIRGGSDGLDSVRVVNGSLGLINGATLHLKNDLLILQAQGAGPGGALSLEGNGSDLSCSTLQVKGGTIRSNGQSFIQNWSFEQDTDAGILHQPAYRAAFGRASKNLAMSSATIAAVTREGSSCYLTFQAYGGLESRSGKVTIDYGEAGMYTYDFTAAGISAPATARYETKSFPFLARGRNATITIEAAPVSDGLGPVIDAVSVSYDGTSQAGALDVRGPVHIYAQTNDSSVGWATIGNRLRASSILVEGGLELVGGNVSGFTTGTAIVSVPLSIAGLLMGYGDVHSENLRLLSNGRLTPGYQWGQLRMAGPPPFAPLTVHGRVSMDPGSHFTAELIERHVSALSVVPGGSGDGGLGLNGELIVKYQYDNPPLPDATLTIARASSISGTFTNIVNGRVMAHAEYYDEESGEYLTEFATFALNITATSVTISDFARLPVVVPVERPANDDFANRVRLGSSTTIDTVGDNTGANVELESGEIEPGYDAGGSVWYEWTASSTGWVAMHTSASAITRGLDTVLAVFSGNVLDSLSMIGYNDESRLPGDFPPDVYTEGLGPSRLVFMATAGMTYQIAVHGFSGGEFFPASGPFELHITPIAAPEFLVTEFSLSSNFVDFENGPADVTFALGVASSSDTFASVAISLNRNGVGFDWDQDGTNISLGDELLVSGTSGNGTYQITATLFKSVLDNGMLIPTILLTSTTGIEYSWTPSGHDVTEDAWLLPDIVSRRLSTVPPTSSGYSSWNEAAFTATELLNSDVSSPGADPNRNGIPNLLEYALGHDPKAIEASSWAAIGSAAIGVDFGPLLSFRVPDPFPNGVILTVEATQSLNENEAWTTLATRSFSQEWMSMNGGLVIPSTASDGKVTVDVHWGPLPGTDELGKFLRLRATVPE